MLQRQNVIIIGAGLAGCVMAIILAKKGFNVEVYESKSDPRATAIAEGKSYNVQLYPRGITALKKLGIWDTSFTKRANVVKGYLTHAENEKNVYTPLHVAAGEFPYQIHREVLHVLLLNKTALYSNIKIKFLTRCVGIDKIKKTMNLVNTKNNKMYQKSAPVIIGADGVNSFVRTFLQQATQCVHTQENFPWGYKEITVPAKDVKRLGLKSHTIHRWPRNDSLLIGFPNRDTSLTFMLMLPNTEQCNFSLLGTEDAIRTFVTRNYPDLLPIFPLFRNALLNHPVGNLTCVTTSPWHYKDSIVLVGDAAHAILPFYGIGMNAAFEDCLLFYELMEKYDNNWQLIFPAFQKLRKPQTDVIYKLAKENFFLLKDKSRQPVYVIKDKILTVLHMFFPKLITPPLYKSIIHTTQPYLTIYKRHMRQEKLLQLLGIDIISFIMSLPLILLQKVSMFRTIIQEKRLA